MPSRIVTAKTPDSTVTFDIKRRPGQTGAVSYLAARLGVAEKWAGDLLCGGHVRLDGLPVGIDGVINLSSGPHSLEVFLPADWPRHMAPTEMPLEVLHEDRHLVVLNKPAGVVVHPARGHLDGQTLQNGMRHRYRRLLCLPGTSIASPHRLDKDTSGAIVFALSRAVYAGLVDQFASRTPRKEYLAVLDGSPDFSVATCLYPIGPDPGRREIGAIVPIGRGGRAAQTDFRVLRRGRGWALTAVLPRTGRPHQIRVHAASLGMPLAGDRDYNPHWERLPFSRQALHAAALSFIHPATGEAVRVEAPLPADFRAALERLEHDFS